MSSIDRDSNHSGRIHLPALVNGIVLAAALALWGCGNDGDETPMEPEPIEPARSTPTELLEDYFKAAYAGQDSNLYAAMLDEEFTFTFLQQDADSIGDSPWGKALDLQSTYRMFGTPDVTSVTLNISVNNALPDTSCVNCQQVETFVTLRVETVGDGTEPLTFTVNSPQTFVVRPDASDSTKWVIIRQIDRESNLKAATDGTSWGNIKGLYR